MKVVVTFILLLLTQPVSARAYQIGTVAPDIGLADLAGNTVSLQQFRGKVVFLNFWASWCTSCREELPELDRLYRKYRDDGLVVIGISVDASSARVAAFLRKHSVTFPVLIDSNGETAEAYRLSGLPTTFIIDKKGVVRHRHSGYDKSISRISDQEVRNLLQH